MDDKGWGQALLQLREVPQYHHWKKQGVFKDTAALGTCNKPSFSITLQVASKIRVTKDAMALKEPALIRTWANNTISQKGKKSSINRTKEIFNE